jgi:hypothetical protein
MQLIYSRVTYGCAGVFFLFGAGRLALVRSQPQKAIDYYTKAMAAQKQYRNLHHISFWEMAIARLALADVDRSLECWRDLEKEATVRCSASFVSPFQSDIFSPVEQEYLHVWDGCVLARELGRRRGRSESPPGGGAQADAARARAAPEDRGQVHPGRGTAFDLSFRPQNADAA